MSEFVDVVVDRAPIVIEIEGPADMVRIRPAALLKEDGGYLLKEDGGRLLV